MEQSTREAVPPQVAVPPAGYTARLREQTFRPRAERREFAPEVSVVVPAYDEAECLAGTLREIFAALDQLGFDFEVIVVDDGSTDETPEVLARMRAREPRLRAFRLEPNCGQSAALGVGFQHARGRVVVMMDADGQNDPHDIPRLLDAMKTCDACCGYRRVRHDRWTRRLAGRLANAVRRAVLHDGIIDSGCSLRAMRADLARELPLAVKGMHRFIPGLLVMRHARLRQIPVNHRARNTGRSKYTNLGRLREALGDLRGVRWMQARYRSGAVTEVR